MTEDAARNELAAIRLFLRVPDGQSILGFLRAAQVPESRGFEPRRCDVPGCIRVKGHANFHCTSDQIARKEDRR